MSPKRMPTILVLAMTTCLSFAFVPPHSYTVRLSPSYAAGKGFGEKNVSPKKQPNKKLEYNDQWTSSSSYNEESNKSVENPIMREQTNNAGQKALQELRRQRAEEKDAELRKMVEMRRMDELAKETPAVIPEKVAMRMGKRMLPFVGIPLFGGMGAFIAFWYLATYKNMEFQPAMVAFTTIAILAVGLLGITYSVMSASWDPDREERGLGFDEFQKNVGILGEGLSRSRENALLRERMAGMSESDIQAALKDLDTRDKNIDKMSEVE